MKYVQSIITTMTLGIAFLIGCGGGGSSYDAKALLVDKTIYEHCTDEPNGTHRKYIFQEDIMTKVDYENNAIDDITTSPVKYLGNRFVITDNDKDAGYCNILNTTEHSYFAECYNSHFNPPVKILETTFWDSLANAYSHDNPCKKF